MDKVYFWNAQRLPRDAGEIAARKEAKHKRAADALQVKIENMASKGVVATPAVTRSKVDDPMEAIKELKNSIADRNERNLAAAEIRGAAEIKYRNEVALISAKKQETETWLVRATRGAPVFFCEVENTYANRYSPLRDGIVPGIKTCCYWTNLPDGLAEPVGFPAVGIGVLGPPGGPHLVHGKNRIPKVVAYRGVNLFFWHALSGNNGQVVAAVWNFIKTTYPDDNNILFGDLNAPPGLVRAAGVPIDEIKGPTGPTRYTGSTLDYALSTLPNVKVARAFDDAVPFEKIKERFGSDHAAMRLSWKL